MDRAGQYAACSIIQLFVILEFNKIMMYNEEDYVTWFGLRSEAICTIYDIEDAIGG
jgi:hypothetical protein